MPKMRPGHRDYRPAAGDADRAFGSGYSNNGEDYVEEGDLQDPETEEERMGRGFRFEVTTVDQVAEVVETIATGLAQPFKKKTKTLAKKDLPDYYDYAEKLAIIGVEPSEIEWLLGGPALKPGNNGAGNGTEVIDDELVKRWNVGNAKGCLALRIAQFKKALSGDRGMQIWLGKQRLAQVEKVDMAHTIGEPAERVKQLPASFENPEDFQALIEKARADGVKLPGEQEV